MKILFIIIDILIMLLLFTIIVNTIHFIKKKKSQKNGETFEENFEVFHDPTFKNNQKTKEYFSSKGVNFNQQRNEKEQWNKLQNKYIENMEYECDTNSEGNFNDKSNYVNL